MFVSLEIGDGERNCRRRRRKLRFQKVPVPEFFFHSENGERFTDAEGLQLQDHLDARREAICTLAELLKSGGDTFWDTGRFRLTVTDAQGLIYFVIDVNGVEAPAVKKRPAQPVDGERTAPAALSV